MDDCARFHLIASLQLDGELDRAEAESLRAHTARCPACRAFEASLRLVAVHLRGSAVPTPTRKRFRDQYVRNH